MGEVEEQNVSAVVVAAPVPVRAGVLRRSFAAPFLAFASIPLDTLVWNITLFSCAVRMLFFALPTVMGHDEWGVLTAGQFQSASDFMLTPSWGESWEMNEAQSHGGRIFWMLGHFLIGWLLPTKNSMEFIFPLVGSVIVIFALAGAAWNMWGRRGMLFVLLITALSPFHLNYAIRALGTMPSVMFLSLSIYCFSRRGWRVGWAFLGGINLGMAFGSHYGTGAAVVAVALGLCFSALMQLFNSDARPLQRLGRFFVIPTVAGIGSVLPLAALEYWAYYGGSSYIHRLFNHENLTVEYDDGPWGMWLRHVFELEPLFQVLCFLIGAFLVARPIFGRWRRGGFILIFIALAVVLGFSLDIPFPRAWVSVFGFGALGLIAFFTRFPGWGWLEGCMEEGEAVLEPIPSNTRENPFGGWALAVSFIVLAGLYTAGRRISLTPRLTFAGWPILTLAMAGLTLAAFRASYASLMRGVAALGLILFLIGLGASFWSKSWTYREAWLRYSYPDAERTGYLNLIIYDDGWEPLRQRASDDVRYNATSGTVYPSISYDEEFFKIPKLTQKLEFHNMDRLLTAQKLVNGSIYFDKGDPKNLTFPPPGTPVVARKFSITGLDGKAANAESDSYRGIEVFFPASQGGVFTQTVKIDLPAKPGVATQAGIEVGASSPNARAGTNVEVVVRNRGAELVKGAALQANEAVNYSVLKAPFTAQSETETLECEIKVTIPAGAYSPPLACYIRRPFVMIPYVVPPTKYTAGVDKILESDTVKNIAFGSDPGPFPQAPTGPFIVPAELKGEARKAAIDKIKPVRWVTAPWSGDPDDLIVLPISFGGVPKCRLSVNGKPAITMLIPETWNMWAGEGGYYIDYKYMGGSSGIDVVMRLKLPKGAGVPGQPVELKLELVEGCSAGGWIAARDYHDIDKLVKIPETP